MKVYGQKPRPRGLIWGFEDEVAKAIAGLIPTPLRVGHPSQVRQEEWDFIVTDVSMSVPARHLYGIGFGCEHLGEVMVHGTGRQMRISLTFGRHSIASLFRIPIGLHPSVSELVRRVLLPLAQGRTRNPVLNRTQVATATPIQEGRPFGSVNSLLETTEPESLAAIVRRETGAEIWCLPPGVSDPLPWIRLALSLWHQQDRNKFPIDPLWRDNPEWLTLPELEIVKSLEELRAERDRVEATMDIREAELHEALATAASTADKGLRRLLTSQGDDLVAAVEETLRDELGFEVSNRDEVNPPNDRREDLWVSSPADDSKWLALVEVRGQVGGAAAVSDLLRLSGRFARRFMLEQGRLPSRLWLLANQFAGSDPSGRPPIFETNPAELAAFEDDQGLAMDTSLLFDLTKRVQRGDVKRDDARRALMEAIGRWEGLHT